MELSSIIKKIGHSLVEIRVRALRNIKCKLEHGLISVPDLVQEKMLFVFLLEWFNFPEVPMQEEVLELLDVLSKHPTGAQMLRDVGAVEFLTQLTPNVEPQLRAIVDGIFDQLFHLSPECLPDMSHEPQLMSPLQTENESSSRGYFQQSKPTQTDVPPPKVSVNAAVRCLKFSAFPWLSLTNTDRHILSSNESSLSSNNPNLVQTTCELLRDVIMQDFPAEIFLQRPSTVQSLLSLLCLDAETDVSYLTLQAIACLHQLCTNLRSRLRFHRDPSFCSAKQDPVSQNSSMSYSQEQRGPQQSVASSPEECSPRPSVVGRPGQRVRGDGQDGDAASNSSGSSQGGATPGLPLQSPQDQAHLELPELESEDPLELQVQQWSLAQFSVATIERAVPLLRTDSLRLFQRLVELLAEVLLLLGDSVAQELWDEPSLTAVELRERLQACMEALGDIMLHHNNPSSDKPESSLVFHRMAYMCSAIFTIRLLQTLMPVEKASENLPESTAGAIFILCLDTPFSLAFPSIHESAVAYLEQASSDSYSIYKTAARAAHSMETTCAFIKEAQAEGDKNWLELLELADQSLEGLPYHQHLPIVKECIQMCSHLWKFTEASPLLMTESQKIFLKLLCHPLLPVKTEAYTCTLNIVKDCLGVHNVAKPASSVSSGVNFLLHSRVLYEITTFGLQDQAREVNSAAKEILLYLLKGRLMMTAPAWRRFNEALHPVIAILQSYAGTNDALGNCILLLSEASDEMGDGAPSQTVRLRAALRLLFTKHHTVRNTAVQHLLPHLTQSEGASTARPALDSAVLSSLPSLYSLNKTVDIKLDNTNRSFVKVECVNKLYSILTSDTVDLVLRKSAAEQLCVVVQDPSMHAVLKSLGIVDKLIHFISESVHSNAMSRDCLLEPSVSILRKLVYADASLRHALAPRSSLLLTLLRASLIIKENQGEVAEAAALMCFLLFDEIARVDIWTDNTEPGSALASFSLPVSVIRRYNLPFQPASHHVVSPHCTVLPPSSDLLSLPPVREMLQFAWNRAWHSGIDGLLEQLNGLRSDIMEFHEDLVMSAAQGSALRVSDVGTGLRDCVRAVRSAGSHGTASEALARMHLYILTDRLALKPCSHSSKSTLQALPWHPAIERFLQVQPASGADQRLLVDIVAFLNIFFKQHRSDSDYQDLRWILELLHKQETNALLNLLPGAERGADARRATQGEAEDLQGLVSQRLQRELTAFFNTLLQRLTHTSDRLCAVLAGPLETQLAVHLLQCLRVSDGPRFYGLPSLERTLRSMAHVTALPGWSTHSSATDSHSLCLKYLSGLLEVISSFYVEWGGNSMSFMGKGVTKNAVICLLHLSHEMMSESKNKDWMSLWSLGHEQSADQQTSAHLGLAWLIPLWVDRDPEVRCASLAVGAALSSLESGCVALAASCQNISGGLWGTLLNILLEQQESSMVRREAAFILQNLLVMPMPANSEEAKDFTWQGPCVHDESSGLALVGLPALQALLYHCQFFEHVCQIVKSCYQGRHAFSLSTPGQPTYSTDDLNDSLRHWKGLSVPVNQSPAPGSMSTSSTLVLPGASGELHSPVPPSPVPPAQDTPVNRLTAQGQSDTDGSESSLSQDSRAAYGSSEPVSIVTPHLVSALCGLLSNLLAVLPEFTLNAFKQNLILSALASLVDAAAIERCVSELRTPALLPGDEEDARKQALSLLRSLSSFSKLLQHASVLSQDLASQLDFLRSLLARIVSVLTLNIADIDAGTRDVVFHTWTDLFMLLATLVCRNASAVCPSVSTALGRHWQPFSGTISVCLGRWASDPPLCAASLHFLCALLSEEAKSRGQETSRSTPSSPLARVLTGAPAEELCETLLQRYEKAPFSDPLKKITAKALMSLLACSPSAQNYACKAGLIDTSVEQMKQIYSRLQMESLNPVRSTHRRKEENSMKELKMILEILRNCLYLNSESKAVAAELRIAAVLLALWPWLLADDPVLAAALELLCVYTANCAAACGSLCGSSSNGAGQPSLPRATVSNSLMHCVMKLASQAIPDNSTIHTLAFSLLANLAISRDCKSVLQKSNFLQHFLSVPVPKPGSRHSGALVTLWLKLLLNVSFGEDGQQMILKLKGSLELLIDMAQHKNSSTKSAALIILHNICFSSINKPKVLANEKAVGLLVSCLDSNLPDVCAIGASALWSLLHNYQKAKATLKYPSIRLKVDEAHTTAKRDAEQKGHQPLHTYLFKCLENVKQLLSS
ncbi:rotatin [Chanos chanos]|uniref:Rotatin n=1 Tax=Chanos chanos TaxID=29144 RepID=A0A6J2UYE9_CHACN|nr:rotatin [Chanos chanos]